MDNNDDFKEITLIDPYDMELSMTDTESDYTESDYEDISENEKYNILNSILLKSGFFNEPEEDLSNYYYVCTKCNQLVYYYQKRDHVRSHKNDNKCCVIS